MAGERRKHEDMEHFLVSESILCIKQQSFIFVKHVFSKFTVCCVINPSAFRFFYKKINRIVKRTHQSNTIWQILTFTGLLDRWILEQEKRRQEVISNSVVQILKSHNLFSSVECVSLTKCYTKLFSLTKNYSIQCESFNFEIYLRESILSSIRSEY